MASKNPMKLITSFAAQESIHKQGKKQLAVDRKNAAAARKKLRDEGKSHEYKTKTIFKSKKK